MSMQFLYCIGAAKAGTTWLALALRNHAQAALPPVKETHYFDSLELGNALWTMDQLIRMRQDVRAEMMAAKDEKTRKASKNRVHEIDRWLGLVGSQRRNDALYQTLMMRKMRPGRKIIADVTPAYALLSSDTYTRMAALNGGKTLFLMILRDPIDRMWSNISMSVAKRVRNGVPAAVAGATIIDGIKRGAEAAEIARSDYAGTLDRLEAAVSADQRLIVFFEDLFDAATLQNIAQFLGLETPLAGPEEKVNASTRSEIAPELKAQLGTLLRPQYEAVAARMGPLPQRWHDSLAQSEAA